MKIVLTKEAKRKLLKDICEKAIRKFPIKGTIKWRFCAVVANTYLVKIETVTKTKEIGLFRKRNIQIQEEKEEEIISIQANANPYSTLFSDTNWNKQILVKSHVEEFDKMAEFIANEISNYTNVILSINTLSIKIGKNPSKR